MDQDFAAVNQGMTDPRPADQPDAGDADPGAAGEFERQKAFWQEWAEEYRGFSEVIGPYRDAQRDFTAFILDALEDDVRREKLRILDAGGGAGNLAERLLSALAESRGGLRGVSYLLTDGTENMIRMAGIRRDDFLRRYPGLEFRIITADTLDEEYNAVVGSAPFDLVVSSWNIEYYPPDLRRALVERLAALTAPAGTTAFAGAVKLPEGLIFKDVLMPLGAAQAVHALLTGGPAGMKEVIAGLKKIARFAVGAAGARFPVKPTLDELRDLAEHAGLAGASAAYHLYGASGMVAARRDGKPVPVPAPAPIGRVLVGRDGYKGHRGIGFWGYLRRLSSSTRRHP